MANLLQKICEDIHKALATYAYVASGRDHVYTNTIYTLTYLGISIDEAKKVYETLTQIPEISPGMYYIDINVKTRCTIA